ncbi:MAG: hypothetical protein ACD_30C00112G0069 [uncultured bacterium]|uniref:Uncharacterized protein n=4 Tax=Candidatus Daviesiibacteriota TaxID=1752718 RepID=A0A0G0FAD4_9BACT|nr:MAG: hypothetical protein ACD_30C00112G0069 [uncultured bacterium]KKQ10510.1 MAG: hypothetical protein US19_C0003G0005 [Candidatus Daviesbacteria bacterium GW2011_GWB1_36_5]KKQ14934.1 MAG: hypothetical protein US28_C0026G0012 [Candidatus Daviesbacteria bacterium GW2011_GWA1_36_8]OGE17228.1 MAG: hypothetical protein A2858_00800 [Candidatus Daviesbacteria bacterium RIFCSPHIGHO2_01_FULL_36_37]OGE36009.1 MAG: hypothetical protein A3E66_01795 [Candidatus Daviesbacteria bacterium RIFCSPHIGHO2_12_F
MNLENASGAIQRGFLDRILVPTTGYTTAELGVLYRMKKAAEDFMENRMPLNEAYVIRDGGREADKGFAAEAFEYFLNRKFFEDRLKYGRLRYGKAYSIRFPGVLRSFRDFQQGNKDSIDDMIKTSLKPNPLDF